MHLTTNGQVLFDFLTLIVEIKYRHRYGTPEEVSTKGYKGINDQDENTDDNPTAL